MIAEHAIWCTGLAHAIETTAELLGRPRAGLSAAEAERLRTLRGELERIAAELRALVEGEGAQNGR